MRAVRVRCFRAESWGFERGEALRAKASGSALVECRWKVVVLRARREASWWIWREVRRVARRFGAWELLSLLSSCLWVEEQGRM
jgi:hypothetical protein